MPLGGTEAALSTSLQSLIGSKLSAATGESVLEPTFLKALCDGIAEAIIPHITANSVTLTTGATAAHGLGAPAPIIAVPGVIT